MHALLRKTVIGTGSLPLWCDLSPDLARQPAERDEGATRCEDSCSSLFSQVTTVRGQVAQDARPTPGSRPEQPNTAHTLEWVTTVCAMHFGGGGDSIRAYVREYKTRSNSTESDTVAP